MTTTPVSQNSWTFPWPKFVRRGFGASEFLPEDICVQHVRSQNQATTQSSMLGTSYRSEAVLSIISTLLVGFSTIPERSLF